MKKTKTIEVSCCDICGGEDMPEACNSCGRVLCWDHRKTDGVEYPHAVYFSGSGDGFYCKECDEKLRKDGTNKRFLAYQDIANLRKEVKTWGADFEKRKKAAEEKLRNLPKN